LCSFFFLSRAHCAVRKETETRFFNGSGTHNTLQVLTLWAKIWMLQMLRLWDGGSI
jgi:hypothetical protein